MAISTLQAKIRSKKNPVVLSLSPEPSSLPDFLLQRAENEPGDPAQALAKACRSFCQGLLEALQPVIPAVSFDSGLFCALGAPGVAAMQSLMQLARELGYYVLLDWMRADLPPAAQALAQACFGTCSVGKKTFTPYACDGVMLNAYLGSDAVKPFTRFCAEGKNVFVLARSANNSARELQDLLSGDRVVHQAIADLAMRWSTDLIGKSGYSEVGVCMSSTNALALSKLRERYPQLFFLVSGPGVREAQKAFDRLGRGAALLAGENILYAFRRKNAPGEEYQKYALEAAERLREQVLGYVNIY